MRKDMYRFWIERDGYGDDYEDYNNDFIMLMRILDFWTYRSYSMIKDNVYYVRVSREDIYLDQIIKDCEHYGIELAYNRT